MEQRQEIKDGVKQRLIEFMAEQITKEESFASLKSELIEELFAKKEIKTPVFNELSKSDLTISPGKQDTFGMVAGVAESKLQEFKDRQAEKFKKILDVRLGKDSNKNVVKMIKQLRDEDSESYSDVIDMLENKNVPSYQESFMDPLLKQDFPEETKQSWRQSTLEALTTILQNPISKDLDAFSINSESKGENYIKTYTVQNKLENFKFTCSYAYNQETKRRLILELSAESKGFKIFGEELGIPFAIEAMEIIDQAEAVRQQAVEFVERKNKRKTVKRKKK